MNVLLFSMPDSFEHTASVTMRMPNGALASLAGNVDPHHRVAVADLILVPRQVRETVERLMREVDPDVVGLSIMTFQRGTARKIAALVRAVKPEVTIVVGGYDPSLASDVYEDPAWNVDVIVRGEGDLTFRDLLRALEAGRGFEGIPGLSYRRGCEIRRNPDRTVSRLTGDEIALPNRAARVLAGYTFIGRPIDVVETSRGCTYDCSFCSIIEMRGRNFHRFDLQRVLDDVADARARGARAIFFVDDNITIDVPRFQDLCRAIIASGQNDVDYVVQGMTAPFATHGAELVPLMKEAGFRYVFLGIENVLEDDLVFLNAGAKNSRQRRGEQRRNTTMEAIDILHRHGLLVVGGLIVGNPTDTPESIAANLEFARRHVDWPYIQHPTPYPGTPMTRDFISGGLIVNPRVEEYDGTTAVTRSEHLDAEEIEFLRWKAERWMKVRHIPAVIRHDTWFVLRNWYGMLAHTFRGSSWRSALGLESGRDVFRRYRQIRAREREYLAWQDPLPAAEGIQRNAPIPIRVA
jgi:radical SAM superfamily enzyme YgiQ (UPF0313 family)